MEQEKVFLTNWKLVATKVFQLSAFVAIAVAAPYFGHQLITGSIVNALLFVSVSVSGIESAFLLCLIPSLISVYTGLLPLSLAPIIPFIMTGNALLVLTFWFLRKNYWLGAILAAFVKFIFVWSIGVLLFGKITLMISWPQFATAIMGAAIAFLFLKIIKRG